MYKKVNLKYKYDDLEPHIDRNTLYVHYNNHYLKYLSNLNELVKDEYNNYTKEQLALNIDVVPINIRGEVLYNLGGVINHEIYFNTMNKPSSSKPYGEVLREINSVYGSYENFKKEFIRVANNLKGSGYTFLVLDRRNNLFIINTFNQDTPYYYGLYPILALDLWEHAYYLKYKYKREDYINNWFNLIDFTAVNDLYKKAKKDYK